MSTIDPLLPEAGAIMSWIAATSNFGLASRFGLRCPSSRSAKSNMDSHRVYSAPVDRAAGIICDQTILYVLVAIVKKRLNLDASLYTLLQILSVTLFEKMPINQALAGGGPKYDIVQVNNQLNLFAY